MRPGLISSLLTAVKMRLGNPRGSGFAAGGRTLAKSSLPKSSSSTSTSNSIELFFPPTSSCRRISTAASPSAPSSPTRDGGASASKGGPLRSSHAHHEHHQQQRGHAAAAAAAAASVAEAPSVADFADVENVGLPASQPPPLRVSFASFPPFETAFPNALSSRRRSLLDEASRRKKELLLKSPPTPFVDEIDVEEKPSTSTSKKPTLAAAPHDSKLALFYNVYGPPPTEAAGRGESARAARDALALFHAVYGPPRQAEEELSSSPSPAPRSSLSPLQLQRTAASPASSPSSTASSPLSPRATTTIAPPELSSPASARRRLSFSKPLSRGIVLERPNRFTMRVRLLENDEVVNCHCPVTGALGGLGMGAFEGAGAPCLVSRVADEGEETEGGESTGGDIKKKRRYYARKTPFTVEAVSLADPCGPPSWVGINQMAANRYIEHFWNAGALPELSSSSPNVSSSSGPAVSTDENDDGGENNGTSPSLVRETRIKDTRSRLDFTASGGRDLVEVKCPLDALPLLRDSGEGSSNSSSSSSSTSISTSKIRPNPVLAAAAALRAQTAGERLARLPRAKRAAMYERAARHASVLAEHLATAKKRERAAALRVRKRARARAVAKRQAAAEAFSSSSSSDPPPPLQQQALAESRDEGDDEEDPLLEGEQEQRARALLIQCFQFDAPPVRGMLPPPKGADPSSDGRAAVAAAMLSAARAGVETWQVNMRFDELGVELLDCFKLDLFPPTEEAASSSSSASKVSKKTTTTTMKNSTKKTKSSSVEATAAAAAAPATTAPSPSPFKESFSSFSLSSSGDESDEGGVLAAA